MTRECGFPKFAYPDPDRADDTQSGHNDLSRHSVIPLCVVSLLTGSDDVRQPSRLSRRSGKREFRVAQYLSFNMRYRP